VARGKRQISSGKQKFGEDRPYTRSGVTSTDAVTDLSEENWVLSSFENSSASGFAGLGLGSCDVDVQSRFLNYVEFTFFRRCQLCDGIELPAQTSAKTRF
jgi:hypothetical protein